MALQATGWWRKKVLRPAIGEEIFIPAKVSHTVINTGAVTIHWFYGCKKK